MRPTESGNHPFPLGGPTVFTRIGRWCYRHRLVVVLLWVAVAMIGGTVLGAVGTDTRTEFSLPDVESREGIDIFDEHFGGAGGGQTAPVVFVADAGVDDPAVEEGMSAYFDEIAGLDDELRVTSPYSEDGAGQTATSGEYAGRLAYAELEVPSDMAAEDATELGTEIRDIEPDIEGVDVELGGQVFVEFEEPTAELVGLAFAIVILIVAFGSVIAMGLPIGVGLAGIGVGTIIAGFLSNVLEVPEFAQMLGIMIGLGVGIDYALFIVTRFRENRARGTSVEQSIVGAINTAGRSVTFAGITVVISLLGMLIMQLGFISGMAISVAVVVAVTMAASLTLLPALIGFVSHRIEITRWRGVIAAGFVSLALLGAAVSQTAVALVGVVLAVGFLLAGFAVKPLRRELPARRQRPTEETFAYRWSRLVQRRPWTSAVLASALLVMLAVPVFGMRLGFADEGNYSEDTDTRQAYDLLADGFGPGYNGPLLLAAEVPEGTDFPALAGITDGIANGVVEGGHIEPVGPDAIEETEVGYRIETEEGYLDVAGPLPNNEENPADSTAVMWRIIPPTSPQDEATSDLVHALRDDVIPTATEDTGVDVVVAGAVASSIDFTDYLSERLPLFLGAVLALSFLLLMVVFRSLLVPLKAVIMNLLGIGAAYGVIVAIFQWGWGGSLIGIDGGPIEPFMPMMLFAIVFGMSMDYEVFLLSRIKEDWDRTGDSHTSVANGLAATARVITAAALIMMVVFGAFALGDERALKMAGIGLGFAVFLDATVIRMLLVPATMELLGDRNWWLPSWLDRILPRIDVEGHGSEDPDDESTDSERPDRELQPV